MTTTLNPTCDHVLDEFAASADRPTPELVRAWIERYPQFAAQIIDYATEWVELLMAEGLAPAEGERSTVDNAVVDKAMSQLQAMLREKDNASTAGVLKSIAASGQSSDQVASGLGLDDSVMLLFDQGLVVIRTIPSRVWQALEAFFHPPMLLQSPLRSVPAAVTARRATAPVAAARPVTFRQAIEMSTLSQEAKQRWFAELDRS